MGTNKVKKCVVRKIIFCTGLTRAAKAGQKSIVPARQAKRTSQERTPLKCTPRVPICLSFNSQQGSPLYGLSANNSLCKHEKTGARHFYNLSSSLWASQSKQNFSWQVFVGPKLWQTWSRRIWKYFQMGSRLNNLAPTSAHIYTLS
jgi:hypothetical protein